MIEGIKDIFGYISMCFGLRLILADHSGINMESFFLTFIGFLLLRIGLEMIIKLKTKKEEVK